MKVIAINGVPQIPDGNTHPESMLRALKGLRVRYQPDQLWRTLESLPRTKEQLPSTAYVLLRLPDVVEALGERHRLDALYYWCDTIRPHYLAIPVALCTMNEI